MLLTNGQGRFGAMMSLSPEKAEALIHRHLAVTELAGIMCYGPEQAARVKRLIAAAGISMHVRARPDCYV